MGKQPEGKVAPECNSLLGKKAPAFKLLDKDGTSHQLKDFDEDFIVLFFYPKDNTPGCTIESKGFSKSLKKFEKLNARVIGISGGNEKSKQKFCSANKLNQLMLSDSDFKVSSKYKVYGKKNFMGKTYLGISRVTFILNQQRKVIKVFDKVSPLTHPKEVLNFISEEISKIK